MAVASPRGPDGSSCPQPIHCTTVPSAITQWLLAVVLARSGTKLRTQVPDTARERRELPGEFQHTPTRTPPSSSSTLRPDSVTARGWNVVGTLPECYRNEYDAMVRMWALIQRPGEKTLLWLCYGFQRVNGTCFWYRIDGWIQLRERNWFLFKWKNLLNDP